MQITPAGMAIGMGISGTYQENSKAALGIAGGFNSASAGIDTHFVTALSNNLARKIFPPEISMSEQGTTLLVAADKILLP